MRARLTAIVASIFLGLGMVLFTAGTAGASTTMPDNGLLDTAAYQHPVAAPSSAAHLDAANGNGPSIHGTLRYEETTTDDQGQETTTRTPVAGVTITVSSQDGEKIDSGESDDKGQWSIPVPEAGHYQVTIDTSTLPEGVSLGSGVSETLPDVRVQSVLPGIAVFTLVSGDSGGADNGSNMSYYLSLALKGLRFGLIVAMAAVGLSLVFGTTGLINFAHGELVTIGAVVTYVFSTSALHWPIVIAVIIAIVLLAIFGGVLDLALWKPLRKRGTGLIQMFIISIGLSLFLRHLVLQFLGGQRHQYKFAQSSVGGENWNIGSVAISPMDAFIIVVSIVVLVGVALMLQKTRMGKAMRALSDNRDLAEASGINVQRVITQVWILGGGLAALGGVFFGLTTSVYWNMGYYLLLLMFAGVILGGLGSAYGAMVGSIIIGFIVQFSVAFSPSSLQNAWALLILIVVLLVRPQGILGRLQRAG